ncbi:hypothetical protein [Neoaquamicrobium sediminum]|uniref:hypothetical protein n=1 Tax=Neoaquamicrobium sediminum TaxID=1849104 RepID=UPI0015675B7A|nr:hypothetical protein [Mesorhizobium sediminum]NRC56560.1 hypothetical protein [Mesorhizobium sediminum]
MAKADRPMRPGGSDPPGSLIVVPPNGERFEDPDVIRRLESFVRKRLPMFDIKVAWVVQPRIETFTVVERAANGKSTANKQAILQALDEFDPDAIELKPD